MLWTGLVWLRIGISGNQDHCGGHMSGEGEVCGLHSGTLSSVPCSRRQCAGDRNKRLLQPSFLEVGSPLHIQVSWVARYDTMEGLHGRFAASEHRPLQVPPAGNTASFRSNAFPDNRVRATQNIVSFPLFH
jgi:hypothetical protein